MTNSALPQAFMDQVWSRIAGHRQIVDRLPVVQQFGLTGGSRRG